MRQNAQDAGERAEQKRILRLKYPNYSAPRHDVFVARFNKELEAARLAAYERERGIT